MSRFIGKPLKRSALVEPIVNIVAGIAGEDRPGDHEFELSLGSIVQQ
jgi:hypothetical protein